MSKTLNNLTPEMLLAMAGVSKEQLKAMTVELALKTQNLTKKDIGTWRQAWQMAINPENPRRNHLYSVYTDIDIDLHLTGCVGQRKGFVMQRAFKLVDKAGAEVKDKTELLEGDWFKDFVDMCLMSRYYGHSLIQFGDVVTVMGKRRFTGVELVPRAHVIPEYQLILRDTSDDLKRGISYLEGPIADWVIEAGKRNDLGLYLKVSPSALSKKNMLAFWDQFGEIFGMPIRIGKTSSRTTEDIDRVEKMLRDMGAAPWGLFPEGTEIEIKETTRGDAFRVFDQRIERANSEMSKGILNQTMTIDSGSSRSQSETHLEVFGNVVESDADFVRDTVNNKLLPFMYRHGFPVEGLLFEWDMTVEYSPEDMRQVEQMLLTGGYEIDPAYFTEKYNIPISGKASAEKLFF